MGQKHSRPTPNTPKLRRWRGKTSVLPKFVHDSTADEEVFPPRENGVHTGALQISCSPQHTGHILRADVGVQVNNNATNVVQAPTAVSEPVDGSRPPVDNVSALLDEIIQILEKDVEESSGMCSDLQQYKFEDIKVRQQSAEVLQPASHSVSVSNAAGEREVEQDSADGRFANYSAYSRLSDSEASLREFEELEKTMELMEASSAQPSREMPVVRQRIRASTPAVQSVVCSEGKAKAAALPYQNKFWIGCGADNLKVFRNPKDRRIESIARLSGCRITLTESKRRNALGQWQQLVIVESASEMGLKKCTNMLDEKFPAFRASSGRMNCKLDFR
ncbi:hypothetical protein SprV_0200915900 [Sparganum proliferum]